MIVFTESQVERRSPKGISARRGEWAPPIAVQRGGTPLLILSHYHGGGSAMRPSPFSMRNVARAYGLRPIYARDCQFMNEFVHNLCKMHKEKL